MTRRIRLAIVIALCACGCDSPPRDGRQATSLYGAPLRIPPLPDQRRDELIAAIVDAREAWYADPTEENTIWVGRRLAYAGRFREAIDFYTSGLKQYPKSYRILRHRGHRYITVREFDKAVADLTRAWELAADQPDRVEPDGMPTPGVPPRSTDKSSILYHLGLAHYLRGDFAKAYDTLALRRTLENANDDTVVSSVHWEYWSLRRLGRDAEAAALVAGVHDMMDVRENQPYFLLARLYAGQVSRHEAQGLADFSGSANLAFSYGIANWLRFEENNPVAAAEALESIVETDPSTNWPSFGYIAAEADLAGR